MPRNRMMDYLMMRDGRNPYGAAGGYVESGRRRRRGRRDRGMEEDYARGGRDRGYMGWDDMAGGSDYARGDNARGRDYGDYESDMARGRGRDRASDYGDYAGDMARGGGRGGDRASDYARGGRDGHYPMGMGEMYYPIEAMGYFNGYYGMGDYAGRDYAMDYARGGRGGNRGGGRDRGYGMDYGYDYAGEDYGSNLTKQELEHWKKKLMQEVDEKDRQFFTKENITQKAKQMGVQMEEFNEEELVLTTLMMYTDYSKTLGTSNMDLYIRLAKDWLMDKDVEMKGGEKLSIYHDCIVEGEDD